MSKNDKANDIIGSGGYLWDGPGAKLKKTKEQKEVSKKIFLLKNFDIKKFSQTFNICEKKFYSCSDKPLFEFKGVINWKDFDSNISQKQFNKVFNEIKNQINKEKEYVDIFIFLKEQHQNIVVLFGESSKGEKLFLRYCRKFFVFSDLNNNQKKQKSNFQTKGNPPFAGSHFSGRYLTGIPKKN